MINYNQIDEEVTRIVDAITSGGGGGGSTVSVTPIRTGGENIADITVNGTVNHIYAPNDAADITYDEENTVAGAISDLNDTLNKRHFLLWENADITSDFAEQTITLSSSDYDELEIVWYLESDGNISISHHYRIVGSTIYSNLFDSSSKIRLRKRHLNIQEGYDSIHFSEGSYHEEGSSRVSDNTRCKPYKIYGIKY